MEKTSVEPDTENDDAGLARVVLAVMEAHRARTAEPGAQSPQLPLSAPETMRPTEDQLASVDSPATSLLSRTAILADPSDPCVLPQADSPSLAFDTRPLRASGGGPFFSSVGRTKEAMEKTSVESDTNADDAKLSRADQLGRNILALMEVHRARIAVPDAVSPQLPPWARKGAPPTEDQLAIVGSPATALTSGTTAILADQPNWRVGKYFFGVGSVVAALLIVIASKLGSPSDGPFGGSSGQPGVASHNPGTSVGPSALVSDGIITSLGGGSIGGELSGQSSQSRSGTSIGSSAVIRSNAVIPVSHASLAEPDKPGISQGAQLSTKISYRPKRKSVKARPKRFRR